MNTTIAFFSNRIFAYNKKVRELNLRLTKIPGIMPEAIHIRRELLELNYRVLECSEIKSELVTRNRAQS